MCHTIAWFSTCAIILCSLAVGCAQAADYHVSPAGRDADPGTAAAPWQTIAKVNTVDLQPGDRVLYEGGNDSALAAKGCSHLAIANLDFVGSGRKSGNTKSGLHRSRHSHR